MVMEQRTPVIALLNLVWEQTNTATAHSWERLNHAMRNALELAIGAGFPFALEDMQYIMMAPRTKRI